MDNTINFNDLHKEYIDLLNFISPYEHELTENNFILEFKVNGLSEFKDINFLKNYNYFEVTFDGESINYLLEILKHNPNYPINECRVRLNKELLLEKPEMELIDFIYFDENSLISNILDIEINEVRKINIGLLNEPDFETKTCNFINLKTIDLENFQTIQINDYDLELMNRLIANSDVSYTYYNNLFSYIPSKNTINTTFQKDIIRKFYTLFFKQISYKEENGIFDIRGKKKIKIRQDIDFSVNNYYIFKDLTEFLYSNDKFLEKFIIVKNVFSRYIHDVETFSSIDKKIIEIFKTTKHYFEKYIQEDLEDFFKNRDVIFKEAVNVSKSINEQNDKVTSYINASLISFLILILSFVYKNFSNISFWPVATAQIGFFIFSWAFYYYIDTSSNERYETVKMQFNLFLDKMGIIQEEEKNEILKSYLTKPNEDLTKSLDRIKELFIYANLVLFIVMLILNLLK
ncbi:hypothetical protein AB1K09_06270 [Solibacillus silvestris]